MPSGSRRAPRPRRTWPQRLLILFNLTIVMGCLGSAGALGYFYVRFEQIPRLELGNSSNGNSVLESQSAPGAPENFLLVGSDTRDTIDPDDPTLGGVIGDEVGRGALADTIMILRVDPQQERVSLLSIPRDLWVEIDGSGRNSRINKAFNNGPEPLIRTINLELGISINHYAQVDFVGFRSVVNAIDGVPVYFDTPARDRVSGLNIETAGCHTLDGDQALAFARARNFQTLVNGRWRTDPTADLGRVVRQQEFMQQVAKRSITKGIRNPLTLNRLATAGIRSVQIDDRLSLDDILDLGARFRSFEPDEIEMFSLPTEAATIRGASVLLLQEQAANPILAAFRSGASGGVAVTPADTSVRVLNGTGAPGQAGLAAEALEAIDFTIDRTADARGLFDRTEIRYAPGNEAKAILLWRHLSTDARVIETPDPGSADLVLITGIDFTTVQEAPKAGEPVLETAEPTATTLDIDATTTTEVPTPTCG